MDQKRRYRRVALARTVEFRWNNKSEFWQTIDISGGGLACLGTPPEALRRGQLQANFHVPDGDTERRFDVAAKLVREWPTEGERPGGFAVSIELARPDHDRLVHILWIERDVMATTPVPDAETLRNAVTLIARLLALTVENRDVLLTRPLREAAFAAWPDVRTEMAELDRRLVDEHPERRELLKRAGLLGEQLRLKSRALQEAIRALTEHGGVRRLLAALARARVLLGSLLEALGLGSATQEFLDILEKAIEDTARADR